MSNQYKNEYGQSITIIDELGKGGEARVFSLADQPDAVAKLYHKPTRSREAKILAMVHRAPEQPADHVSLAWPTQILYRHNRFVGFVMPKVTGAESIFNFYNPQVRRERYPNFSWHMMHRLAINLVKVMQAIHEKGHVVGDINESNILVTYAIANPTTTVLLRFARVFGSQVEPHFLDNPLITFVDTDSFQIQDEQGIVHRSLVGKPEYTPPELQRVPFSKIDQTIAHDLFGLGVLLFQMLMSGFNPFAGVLNSRESVGRVDLHNIREGLFPYYPNERVAPPPVAPPFGRLHPTLQQLFVRCFEDGYHQPNQRPTALEWQKGLQEAEQNLGSCWRGGHVYSLHLNFCPWCYPNRALQPSSVQVLPRPVGFRAEPLIKPASRPPQKSIISSQTPISQTKHVSPIYIPPAIPTLKPNHFVPVLNVRQVLYHDIGAGQVTCIAFTPDSQAFLTGYLRSQQRVSFQTVNNQLLYHLLLPTRHPTYIRHIAISADNRLVAMALEKGVYIWRNKPNSRAEWFLQTGLALLVAFSPDSQTIAVSRRDQLQIWSSQDPTRPTYTMSMRPLRTIRFSEDSQQLITIQNNSTFEVWDVKTGKRLHQIVQSRWLRSATLSLETGLVATLTTKHQLILSHISDGQPIWTTSVPATLFSLQFSPDGQFLVSDGFNNEFYLWRVNDGHRMVQQISDHEKNQLHSFSPNSNILVTSVGDNVTKLWDWRLVPQTEPTKPVRTAKQQTALRRVRQRLVRVINQPGQRLAKVINQPGQRLAKVINQPALQLPYLIQQPGQQLARVITLGVKQNPRPIEAVYQPNLLPEIKQTVIKAGISHSSIIHIPADIANAGQALTSAIASASIDTTIHLSAGVYHLSETLTINKPVSLIGQGMAKTRIMGPKTMVSVQVKETLFTAQNITFVGVGLDNTDKVVMVADDAELTITECQFREGHIGLLLTGVSIGQISDCLFDTNRYVGLSYQEQSSGIANANTCQNNHRAGIWVTGQAEVDVTENICQKNTCAGIAYTDFASGTVHKNRCLNNQFRGISIDKMAQPTIIENICRSNSTGICYNDQAMGETLHNICEANRMSGITVWNEARPILIQNICNKNKRSGIYHDTHTSEGIITQNSCEHNLYGIQVAGFSRPILLQNSCQNNREAGIYYYKYSAGIARENRCVDNGQEAIQLEKSTYPMLYNNIFDESSVIEDRSITDDTSGKPYSIISVSADLPDAGEALVEAVATAPKGTTIQLTAGEYRLAETLFINQFLMLRGAGMEQTKIIGPNGAIGIELNNATFVAQNLTFEGINSEKTEKQILVRGTHAKVTITACRFWQGHTGLLLGGTTIGTITACELKNNMVGLALTGGTAVTITACRLENNEEAGLIYRDQSGGLAKQNICQSNGHGIILDDRPMPTLTKNIVIENRGNGIFYRNINGHGGTARKNRCKRNGDTGIKIYHKADPSMDANICLQNRHGIRRYGK